MEMILRSRADGLAAIDLPHHFFARESATYGAEGMSRSA